MAPAPARTSTVERLQPANQSGAHNPNMVQPRKASSETSRLGPAAGSQSGAGDTADSDEVSFVFATADVSGPWDCPPQYQNFSLRPNCMSRGLYVTRATGASDH